MKELTEKEKEELMKYALPKFQEIILGNLVKKIEEDEEEIDE